MLQTHLTACCFEARCVVSCAGLESQNTPPGQPASSFGGMGESPPTSASSSMSTEAQALQQEGSGRLPQTLEDLPKRPQTLEDLPKHSTSPDQEAAASPPKVSLCFANVCVCVKPLRVFLDQKISTVSLNPNAAPACGDTHGPQDNLTIR